MKTLTATVTLLSLLTIAGPLTAAPQRNYRPHDGKAMARQAGFDEGFWRGFRDGRMDHRAGLRFNYRGRDRLRALDAHAFGSRHQGDFKKGFRDGYRRGYEEGYRRFDYRRFPGPRGRW